MSVLRSEFLVSFVHLRTHTDEKPFQCLKCRTTFVICWKLAILQEPTRKKVFQCLECEKSFSLAGSLSRPHRTYTGEKPFDYLECGKSFSHHTNLAGRDLALTAKKPSECLTCGEMFGKRTLLIIPVRAVAFLYPPGITPSWGNLVRIPFSLSSHFIPSHLFGSAL